MSIAVGGPGTATRVGGRDAGTLASIGGGEADWVEEVSMATAAATKRNGAGRGGATAPSTISGAATSAGVADRLGITSLSEMGGGATIRCLVLFFIARVYRALRISTGRASWNDRRTVALAPISKKSETSFDQSSSVGAFFKSKSTTRGANKHCNTRQYDVDRPGR